MHSGSCITTGHHNGLQGAAELVLPCHLLYDTGLGHQIDYGRKSQIRNAYADAPMQAVWVQLHISTFYLAKLQYWKGAQKKPNTFEIYRACCQSQT